MKKIPEFLEYFLEDILGGNREFSAKRMFSGYSIYKNKKIFAFFSDGDLYFRKNIFTENLEQFCYEKKGKTIFLPYFKIDESILEDREELEKWIESSLDY
ncbi:transcriptional regulator [Candidatus Gracilibacteria bacterium]|nr:MAG: transcriptional regulator [Candidatus Gracilibacteria bacterium]